MNIFSVDAISITAGARASALSRAQVQEVEQSLKGYFPDVGITPHYLETVGDKELTTSLRGMEKTDFFTREVDASLLAGSCRIGIHSAKDLPEPLPKGLEIVAITQGQDPGDVLVLRPQERLETLKPGAVIATSSARRECSVRSLRKDLSFIDLRGAIPQRLAKLESGEADGVVVAEAALIRLNLTHLNRIRLPGETVPLQGKLAIVARSEDRAMRSLFSLLDTRKKALYLGLRAPKSNPSINYLPFCVIETRPLPYSDPAIRAAFSALETATHLIFTSQTAIPLFLQAMQHFGLPNHLLLNMTLAAVGNATAASLESFGFKAAIIAQQETSEGLVDALSAHMPAKARFFWPHSAKSRNVLPEYFRKATIPLIDVALYDTVTKNPGPLPSSQDFDEIVFTSPSTVEAFFALYPAYEGNAAYRAIGPVTAEALSHKMIAKQKKPC